MKQHITTKQWDEVSENNQELLANHKYQNGYVLYEKLNIGQMIGFLGDRWFFNITPDAQYDEDVVHDLCEIKNNGLCDALWEAVKYKLNN